MDELLKFAYFITVYFVLCIMSFFYLPAFHFEHSHKMEFLNVSNNSYHKEYEMKGKAYAEVN